MKESQFDEYSDKIFSEIFKVGCGLVLGLTVVLGLLTYMLYLISCS